jgi:hypothetical protein
MSDDDVAIINAAADAAKMARLHGCAIDVNIDRWGRKIHVQVSPSGEVELGDLDGTAVLEPVAAGQIPAERPAKKRRSGMSSDGSDALPSVTSPSA